MYARGLRWFFRQIGVSHMLILTTNWWAFVLRGIFAILFGILTFILPGMALVTLVFLWGFYALADGVFTLVAAFRHDRTQRHWWALLIEGLLGIIAGVIAFVYPGLTALVLLFVIAGWAIATGVMEIVAAVRLRKQIKGEWLLALAGVVSILFGALLVWHPGAGALALVLWIGAYAIVFGVLLISLGLRLRSALRTIERPGDAGHGYGNVAPSH
jgi:uncharacterized membrane protein HdeD (DUF308 family)